MSTVTLIAHNLRSTHNIGSLLRTADGLGVNKLYLTGYTPYPQLIDDPRLPHIATKLTQQIHKTALDAERTVDWEQRDDITSLINELQAAGATVTALEQTDHSQQLPNWPPAENQVIIVGREVEGIEPEIVALCDSAVEIPMLGAKESLNVVQAAAIALYHCRYYHQLVQ